MSVEIPGEWKTAKRARHSARSEALRLAVVVSHPIQYFAPWYRETAKLPGIQLQVFFCCDWGLREYVDPGFGVTVRWDIPLTDGYEHRFLSLRERPRRLTFAALDNPDIEEALASFAPDVLLVFGYAYRTHWRAVRWARRNNTLVLLYSDSQFGRRVALWKRPVKAFVVRRFYARVDGALAVGDSNLAYHMHYGLPAARIFRGCLPVDRERLLGAVSDREAARLEVRRRFGIPPGAFVALFCGKLVSRKRPLDLARAVMAAEGETWAMFVGDGPLAPELRRLARGCPRLVVVGFVNQREIPRFFAACDALAMTSENEPHPVVVTEAACFGLPVVASDRVGCVGPADTARPGFNAMVYPCGDEEALADCLRVLRDDPALRKRLGEGSLSIAANHDATAAAAQLRDACQCLLQLGPRRS